jgi:MarR family transcriptional regulator, temperature-dependent positive regulator of motility
MRRNGVSSADGIKSPFRSSVYGCSVDRYSVYHYIAVMAPRKSRRFPDLEDSLGQQVRRANQALSALWQDHMPELTRTQFSVLKVLHENGPLDQSALGALTAIDRSTLTPLLDSLESRNLVEKAIDRTNRRRRIITMTAAGHSFLDEILPRWSRLDEQFRSSFHPHDFQNLMRMLRLLGDLFPIAPGDAQAQQRRTDDRS